MPLILNVRIISWPVIVVSYLGIFFQLIIIVIIIIIIIIVIIIVLLVLSC